MNRVLMLSMCLSLLSCNKKIEVLPNQVGIVVNEAGNIIDTTEVLYFGNYILKPSQEIVYFDISNQSREFEIVSILKDKKEIDFTFTIFFRPISKKTPILYKQYGDNYIDELLVQNMQKIIVEELANYNTPEVISKELLGKIIFDRIQDESSYNNLIEILDVNVTNLNIND